MIEHLQLHLTLAQEDAPPPAAPQATAPAPSQTTAPGSETTTPGTPGTTTTAPPPQSPMGGSYFIFILLGVMVLMFVFTARSQKKEKKKRQAMIDAIKKGDRVQTIGGVLGVVTDIRDDEVTLKVDESSNTKIRFARSAVQTVVQSKD